MRAARRGHALGHHAHGRGDRLQRFAPAETFTDLAVAAVAAETGHHQVADAAQPLEGFPPPAHPHAEAHEFGEAAGHERGLGVVAEAKAVADPGGNGEDVFQRAAEFDPGDVVARVGAQGAGVEDRLQADGDGAPVAADDDGCRAVAGDLLRVAGAGENRHGAVPAGIRRGFRSSARRCRIRCPWCTKAAWRPARGAPGRDLSRHLAQDAATASRTPACPLGGRGEVVHRQDGRRQRDPGRYLALARVSRRQRMCAGSCPQSVTASPRAASQTASAVPQLPAPRTAIFRKGVMEAPNWQMQNALSSGQRLRRVRARDEACLGAVEQAADVAPVPPEDQCNGATSEK